MLDRGSEISTNLRAAEKSMEGCEMYSTRSASDNCRRHFKGAGWLGKRKMELTVYYEKKI